MIHHMLDSLWRRRWAGALAAAVTPPNLGADGEPLPGSIAEVSTVRIGGVDQGVLMRRQSTDNPVLLYLAGGPGQLLSLFPLPSLPLSFPPPIPRSTRQPRPAAHLSASPRSHTARSAGQAGGPRAKPGAQQAKQRDQKAKPHDQKAKPGALNSKWEGGRITGGERWLRVRVHLSIKRDKLPCANTYQNVCDQIDLAALNSRLADFFALPLIEQPVEAEASVATTVVVESTELKSAEIESGSAQPAPAVPSEMAAPAPHQWVLDGKTLCGSHRLGQGKQAQSTLALYDLESRHVVAQRPLAGKGHERATALALVQELDLHGILLSADALHTQPAWCHCVRRQGGDYLLIAKANQRTLYADIAYLFSEQPRP